MTMPKFFVALILAVSASMVVGKPLEPARAVDPFCRLTMNNPIRLGNPHPQFCPGHEYSVEVTAVPGSKIRIDVREERAGSPGDPERIGTIVCSPVVVQEQKVRCGDRLAVVWKEISKNAAIEVEVSDHL